MALQRRPRGPYLPFGYGYPRIPLFPRRRIPPPQNIPETPTTGEKPCK